jgi:hypothetical protein
MNEAMDECMISTSAVYLPTVIVRGQLHEVNAGDSSSAVLVFLPLGLSPALFPRETNYREFLP